MLLVDSVSPPFVLIFVLYGQLSCNVFILCGEAKNCFPQCGQYCKYSRDPGTTGSFSFHAAFCHNRHLPMLRVTRPVWKDPPLQHFMLFFHILLHWTFRRLTWSQSIDNAYEQIFKIWSKFKWMFEWIWINPLQCLIHTLQYSLASTKNILPISLQMKGELRKQAISNYHF